MSLGICFHSLTAHSRSFVFKGKEVEFTGIKFSLFFCPLALRARVDATTGRSPDQKITLQKSYYLAPNDAPWHSQLNQPGWKFPCNVNQNYFLWHGRFLKGTLLLV